MDGSVAPPDDPDISSDANLLRRIHPSWIKPDPIAGHRIASGAFQDLTDEDGTRAMSVFVEDRLVELGYSAVDLVAGLPGFGLAAISAGLVRELGLTVTWAPSPKDGPIGEAHAHVHGKKTGSVQRRLAQASERRFWPTEG